ncbi:MAG: aldo/keto reductase [Candidatus Puniceispirillaceae bacterium]
MERIALSDEIECSRLIYGLWRLCDDSDTSLKHVQAKAEACLAQGITSFDEADIYGDYESEKLFGQMLANAPHMRDQMEIISKCDIKLITDKVPDRPVKSYDTSAAYITAQVENSLRLMGIDALDLLLLHRPDPLMDHYETGRVLDQLVADGKIRSVGVSNFRPWDISLLQSAMASPIVTNQIEISLNAHEALVNGDIAFCQEHDIRPMAWSPLGGGSLFGQSDMAKTLSDMAAEKEVDAAALAIAWLLKHPAKIMPVMGSNNLQRIARFSEACDINLSRDEWYLLYQAALGREVA